MLHAGIEVPCATNKALDLSDGKCKNTIGFIFTCPGTYDEATGVCVVQGKVSYECPRGSIEQPDGSCVAEREIDCEVGKAVLQDERWVCLITPDIVKDLRCDGNLVEKDGGYICEVDQN